MAKVLYIEDDDVAVKAMDGIMRRNHHEITHVKSGSDAWNLLLESVDYDLIIGELKLQDSNLVTLIKEIRANPFTAEIPVVIYSKVHDKDVVKKLLTIGLQNYLFKPYKEAAILEEVKKALKKQWQIVSSGPVKKYQRFMDEEATSFNAANKIHCDKMEFLSGKYAAAKQAGRAEIMGLITDITELSNEAKKIGFHTFSEMLGECIEHISNDKHDKFFNLMEIYPNAQILQKYRSELIERTIHGSGGSTEIEEEEVFEETITKRYDLEESEEKIKEVKDYPVIESAAASFQMALDDEETNLDDIVEMVQRDAGLAASLLRFANTSDVAPGAAITDIHQAIATLGLQKTKMLSLSLKAVPAVSSMFTALKWEDFWMHQVGCAMLTEEIAAKLKLPTKPEILYLSGLVQDMGKVLLHEVDKELYQQAIKKAAAKELPLQEIEREYFGCSHENAGLIFAKDSGMPDELQDALKYQFEPNSAPRSRDAVGALSLANFFCMKYEIGYNGDRLRGSQELSSHPAWEALKDWRPSDFSTPKFTREMETRIKSLKFALAGLAKEQSKSSSSA